MARFSLKIDVEPNDIPKLDDAHKRDCADAINRAIDKSLKYTMIFSIAVAAYYAAYSFFGFSYLLRMNKILEPILFLVPLFAILIFILEFIAGMMKKPAILLEIILNSALAVVSVTQYQTMMIFPFAVYGAILHINLLGMIPHYDVISKLQGFPEFTSLPIGDPIKKRDEVSAPEEAPAEAVKDSVPEEKPEESPAEAVKDAAPEEKPEESPAEEVKDTAPEEKPEKAPAEAAKSSGTSRNGNSSKKKRKKKNRS